MAPRRRPGRTTSPLRILAPLFALPLALPALIWLYYLLFGGPLPGVRVAGLSLPRSGDPAAFLRAKAQLWSEESVLIEAGYHRFHPSHAELGAELSVEEALRQLHEHGRSANPIVTLSGWWQGMFGPGNDLRWRPNISDREALNRYVQKIREQVDRLPTLGSYDPAGNPIDGLPGEALDVEVTRRAIHRALAQGKRSLKVATLVTPPPRAFRRFEDPTAETEVLMISQETEYRPGNGGRATNIELAARFLNGQLLMPGASLSFNQVVGKRDAARGFAPATELLNGEVAMGIGGGVCQVAGTLHAAAFFAGLVVEEYRPHSRLNQFAYLRPGLDTMVAWPDHVHDVADTKDMRLRNPYPFPVLIKTATYLKQPHQAALKVELYGAARPFRVDWSFEEIDRVPAGEVQRIDPTLAPGQSKVQQQPLDGLVILRRRTIYMPTRRVEEETKVAYPPTPRIVLVGTS